jgi:hypothetical protein
LFGHDAQGVERFACLSVRQGRGRPLDRLRAR